MLETVLRILKKIIPKPLFLFFQPVYHFLLALTGNIVYRLPGYKMTVIGVTGTNGKSTTCEIIAEILKSAGEKVGMISTVDIEIAGKRRENTAGRTTIGRWGTHRLMREMVEEDCKYAVIEVASEGIAWYRIWGIPFDGAVFTNLSPEHLNYHKTMENYRDTKGKLFQKLSSPFNFKKTKRVSVINADGKESDYFLSFETDEKYMFGIDSRPSLSAGEIPASAGMTEGSGNDPTSPRLRGAGKRERGNDPRTISKCGAGKRGAGMTHAPLQGTGQAEGDGNDNRVIAKNIRLKTDGVEYDIEFESKKIHVDTKAIGEFNVYNELAAFCMGLGYDIDSGAMIKVFENFGGTKGRAEKIDEGQSFDVIIDYAVTPDALESLYKSLREITKGKLISVFGATGDKDKTKRPDMGRVASELTDMAVLTDDETYTEDSGTIIDEVYAGVPEKNKNKVKIIQDRLEAIKKAINLAEKGDTVVITGIGHQKFRNMGGKKVVWDERRIVSDILKNKKEKK